MTGMDAATAILSDTILDHHDAPFRVFAGPGAGKTYWLAKQLSHLVATPGRLRPGTSIACVSYTNIASDVMRRQLSSRLGPSSSRIEVTTIHAFLYKYVVAPYAHLVVDRDNKPLLNTTLLDGHDEHHPAHDKIDGWLRATTRLNIGMFADSKGALYDALRRLQWKIDGGALTLSCLKYPTPKYFPSTQLDTYKLLYWADGIIDHDDVMYFACRILTEHRVAPFLAARFPYIFVDEFQDTNPIQTRVVKMMAEGGSVVGVVGDPRQSIYGFQGARPEDFDAFSLAGQRDYKIAGNRRSTKTIVGFLNQVRGDSLQQQALREEVGDPVRILVGETRACVDHVKQRLSGEDIVLLGRNNDDVVRLRTGATISIDRWAELDEVDSYRARFLRAVCTSIVSSRGGFHSGAVKTMHDGLRVKQGKLQEPLKSDLVVGKLGRRSTALLIVEAGLELAVAGTSVLAFYNNISERMSAAIGVSLKRALRGKFFDLASVIDIDELLTSLPLADEDRLERTIHKSKGDEFKNALVVLDESSLKTHIFPTKGKIKPNEESNIRYVALSRARDRLFIVVPSLDPSTEERIRAIASQIEVERL